MRFAISLMIAALFLTAAGRATACLRPELDERAIQWSSIIVKANLVSSQQPAAEKGAPRALVVSTWKVTQVFDGQIKADAEITLYTFPSNNPDVPSDPCAVLPGVGKSMVLLLRLAKDCEYDERKDVLEKPGDAYVIVHRMEEEDITDDAVKDLQQKIADTRKAESTFSDKEAAFQADTLMNAVDDIEADHADSALLDMGPKAVPAMKAALAKASGAGKTRLERIIEELSPPPADTGRRDKTTP